LTHLQLAQRLAGEINEIPGDRHHPAIQWAHLLCGLPDEKDETPWCSSFVNLVCWLHRLPRSKSARARSWLRVGLAVSNVKDAEPGDVVVLTRGNNPPGPEVIAAPGHVGFFVGKTGDMIELLGGNQSNAVNVSRYSVGRVLGVRRLT